MSKNQLSGQNRRFLPAVKYTKYQKKAYIKPFYRCYVCNLEVETKIIKGHYYACIKKKKTKM